MTTLPSHDEQVQLAGAYHDAAPTYRGRGWAGTLPCDWPSAGQPPAGFTGGAQSPNWGVYPSDDQVRTWCETRGSAALGLRVPDDVLVFDIDCYDGKNGCARLEWWTDQVGEALPPTWYSTSRQDGSRKLFFRVPRYGARAWREPGDGFELLRHDHRWVRVWPSRNPKTGAEERWFDPNGVLSELPPEPGDLTELPASWRASLLRKPDGERNGSVNGSTSSNATHERFDWSAFADAVPAGAQNQLLHDALSSLRGGSREGLRLVGHLLAQRFVNDPASKKGPWTATDVDAVVQSVLRYPNGPSEAALTPDQARWADQLARGDVEPLAGWLSVTKLAALAPSSYVVKYVIPSPGVVLLHGDGGVGKSFVLLDVALHAALGREWCGYRVRRRRVGMIWSESPSLAYRRRDAWLLRHGVELDELRDRVLIYPGRLNLTGSRTPLEALVEWVQRAGIDVVTIDTLRRNMTGDENSARDVSQAMWLADELVQAGVTVVLTHHDNKAGTYSGTTALHGHVDSRLHLTRDERDHSVLRLEIEKQRDSADDDVVYGRLEAVPLGVDDDGDAFGSSVFVPCDEPEDPRHGSFAIQAQLDAEVARLVELVQARPGCTTRHLREHMNIRAERVAYVIEEAESRELIRRESGARNSQLHYPT